MLIPSDSHLYSSLPDFISKGRAKAVVFNLASVSRIGAEHADTVKKVIDNNATMKILFLLHFIELLIISYFIILCRNRQQLLRHRLDF